MIGSLIELAPLERIIQSQGKCITSCDVKLLQALFSTAVDEAHGDLFSSSCFSQKVNCRQYFKKPNHLDDCAGFMEAGGFIISCLSCQLFQAKDASPRGGVKNLCEMETTQFKQSQYGPGGPLPTQAAD